MAQQDATNVAITGGTARLTRMALNGTVSSNKQLAIDYAKNTDFGIALHPNDLDGGAGAPVVFTNLAGALVGSIGTSATATAYNTSSDGPLKTAVEAPHWRPGGGAGSCGPSRTCGRRMIVPGVGFLADEVQQVIPDGVVTGERDAVEDDGYQSGRSKWTIASSSHG